MENEKIYRLYINYNLQLFAKDGPGGEKTEPATPKKLKEARDDGKVAKSKELNAAFELLALFLIVKLLSSYLANNFIEGFSSVYKKIPDIVNDSAGGFKINTASNIINYGMKQIFMSIWPVFLISIAISFGVSVFQVKWKVTAKPLKPKFSKMSPAQGFKKIFSKDSLVELLKSILKIFLICMIAYTSIRDYASDLFLLYDIGLMQAIALIGEIIIDTGIKISVFYIVLGVADYAYNKFRFNEDMKMTKQEVKDEFKNTEGNPEIKGRQRQIMRQVSQRRMMANVPKADVVITNPTHLAVALKYDNQVSDAPIVLAKGEDFLANKIKEVARENSIEIVENKPLARMLYANVDVGQQIPPELYQAVAEVLAAVYKKKNGY